ncbi:MAG: hypothetical protein ACTSQY_11405 [Candidatus Odinarchaeia archaeon]
MNERQAIEKGYSFTGVYKNNKEDVKARKVEFKSYKTVIVPVKANPYSRGQKTGITGYSLYAEQKYFVDQRIKELEKEVDSFTNKMRDLSYEFEQKRAELITRNNESKFRLNKLKGK